MKVGIYDQVGMSPLDFVIIFYGKALVGSFSDRLSNSRLHYKHKERKQE